MALVAIFLFISTSTSFASASESNSHHFLRSAQVDEDFDSGRTPIPSYPHGTVEISEEITYDFGYASRHGIFRYIPFKYEFEGVKPKGAVKGSRYSRVTPIEINQVFMDGQKVNSEVSEENNNKGHQPALRQ